MNDQVRELEEQAREKGMVLVDSNGFAALKEEYVQSMAEAERLCEVIDPENKPFDSKYKARDLLDGIFKKLEANKAIATLEKNEQLLRQIRPLQAALKTKTGLICWDCEEPHNAQQDLEEAAAFYFPQLVQKVEEMVGGEGKEQNGEELEALIPALMTVLQQADYLLEGMKCLNILGILWSGRGQPSKAVVYLLAAKNYFLCHHQREAAQGNAQIEDTYTHTLFYLAQAYGHLQDSSRSSDYCKQTLQRQLEAGLVDIKSMLQWVKNCAGIADYYLALQQYASASCALLSAEKVFKEQVLKALYAQFDHEVAPDSADANKKPNFVQGNLNAAEIEADLHRRFSVIDVLILKRAMERSKQWEVAQQIEIDLNALAEELSTDERDDQATISKLVRSGEEGMVEMFTGLAVAKPVQVFSSEITTFEAARLVFLRAAARIESAKKYYVLDGYVTDHVGLLQEYSKLYHYLAAFEKDVKRRIAMETRRLDMLVPIVNALNKVSYEVLHKQISYELGEAALCLIDLKLDKLREKNGGSDVITEKSFKKGELVKYSEYCKIGLAMFAHFTYMYAYNKDRCAEQSYAHLEALPMYKLATTYCQEPDESKIPSAMLHRSVFLTSLIV